MRYILKNEESGCYLVSDKPGYSLVGSRIHATLFSQAQAYLLRRRFVNLRIYKTMTQYILYYMDNGAKHYIEKVIIHDKGYDLQASQAINYRTHKIADRSDANESAKATRTIVQEVAI